MHYLYAEVKSRKKTPKKKPGAGRRKRTEKRPSKRYNPRVISSHLSPEPERRLWIIHENLRHEQERVENKLALAGALSLAQLWAVHHSWAAYPLAAAFIVALLGATAGRWRRLSFLDPGDRKDIVDDYLVTPAGLAKYTHGDLIARFDKFLGGGITNTKYFEDLIGEIAALAKTAWRKQRLFRASCVLLWLGQLALAGARLF